MIMTIDGMFGHGGYLWYLIKMLKRLAPPGWHWEVLPSGTRSLVRNPGDVVDPDLL